MCRKGTVHSGGNAKIAAMSAMATFRRLGIRINSFFQRRASGSVTLSNWEKIATYLPCGIRTVQRREALWHTRISERDVIVHDLGVLRLLPTGPTVRERLEWQELAGTRILARATKLTRSVNSRYHSHRSLL